MTTHRPRPRAARGFTLMELLVVVAIVGILASIAYPNYMENVRASRRTDAKTALLDFATRQERFFTMQNRYSASADTLGYARLPVEIQTSGQAFYRLEVRLDTPTTYIATATPINAQAGDACGSYTIDYLGAQGNLGNSRASVQCW
ncbi:type IV pilin protein [Cupriavidus pinatubonensis]|uniref:Type IV pilus assembly protein PilE n=1 Tax=Cupriavidus pinatubonensis TaxID=248026 RepID=A0ABM8XLT1_9BURK|nr:type IV pilin protein [Cupriavidus pinatubonensis]CAG9181204.1 hypothetical protein LMG23994_04615 [Cupriavidus pinatubonensis]